MRKRWTPALGIAVAMGASAARANPADAFLQYQNGVVAVTYYVETNVMHEVREVGGRDIGVLVAPDLIVVNGAIATSSTTGAQPHDFKIHFYSGEERGASYIGRDEFANLAFLRLSDKAPAGARPLPFGGKTPVLHVGDPVFAIGLLPENLEPMVRMADGHVVASVERPKPFLVTDLPVEFALGGPVFAANGRLLGILSELGEAGPSFAQSFGGDGERGAGLVIDAATVAKLASAPPRKGQNNKAWLGITLQALDKDMAEYWGLPRSTGIVVNSVLPESPAAAAGLQEGDIVVSLNGAPVPVSQEDHVSVFIEQIGSNPVGSTLKLGVVRAGKRFDTGVTLAAAPKSRLDAETYHSEEFEITVRELVFQDYRSFDLKPEFKGVLVSKVDEGGWAGVGGLESGDIVQKVDDQAIAAPSDMKRTLDDAVAHKRRKLVFFVQRGGRTQFITVQPSWGQS